MNPEDAIQEDPNFDPTGWAPPVKGLRQSICATCRWKHEGSSTCLAFGGGIPTAILIGQIDHRKPFPGDLGVQYEKKTEAEALEDLTP